uniref:Non-structural maintenance of chromosomes element 1 homolog n=1 Tax=Caenorhabditis tropicalis TaxID=1561998 RepID=A0A1I7TET0_9PELO
MDDDDVAPANARVDASADVMPHGDFDLEAIYSNLKLEVPKMEKIVIQAKKFGDSHRYLINQFCLEPMMSTKKMNLLFAKHLTTVKYHKHPEVVMRIQTTPEESRELSKALVKTMNSEDGKMKKTFRPWRFVISTDEKTPNEFVTMTGCSRNSSIISEASDLTKAERALFFAIVEEMITDDGVVPMKVIQQMIQHEPHKILGAKLDIFITRMVRQKYFLMDAEKDNLEISPRTLIELDAWIRAKFSKEIKLCKFCTKIIAKPVYTAECQKCHSLFHFNCFINATNISKQQHIECVKCNEKIFLHDVKERIETKKLEAIAHSRSRGVRRRPSIPVQTVDSDDGEEESSNKNKKKKDKSEVEKTEVDEEETIEETVEEEEASQVATKKRKHKRRTIIDSDSD